MNKSIFALFIIMPLIFTYTLQANKSECMKKAELFFTTCMQDTQKKRPNKEVYYYPNKCIISNEDSRNFLNSYTGIQGFYNKMKFYMIHNQRGTYTETGNWPTCNKWTQVAYERCINNKNIYNAIKN